MKKLNFIKVLGLVALFLSSSLTKGQGQVPDSQWRVVPISSLKYSNFIGEPISLVDDVVVIQAYNRGGIVGKNFYWNDKQITFPAFAVNLKTGKILFPEGSDSTDLELIKSPSKNNIFYMISYERGLIEIQVNKDTVIQKTKFISSNVFINCMLEGVGDEIFIANGYKGIILLYGDSIIKEYPLPGISIGSLVKWNNLIVFGGHMGQVGTLDPVSGNIEAISNGMNFSNNVSLNVINGSVYAIATVSSKKGLYKYSGNGSSWTMINPTGTTVSSLKWDNIVGEYRASYSGVPDFICKFQNDSFIEIPKNPFKGIEYIESYRDTMYTRYGWNVGNTGGYFFEWQDSVYAVGQGMIGVIRKVEMPTDGIYSHQMKKIFIYPNPATSQIIISNLERETEIVVSDIMGQLVLSLKTTDTININDLVPGLYFLNIAGYQPTKFIKK